ncbi:hypothetical protein CR513_02875, partial [Mucuna pruriens]
MNLDIVENENFIPKTQDGVDLPRIGWSEYQKIKYQLNSQARNFLTCVDTKPRYEKIHSSKIAKEIWDMLAFTVTS